MDARASGEDITSSDLPDRDGADKGSVVNVTADTFRKLTVRLRTRRVATPEAAALLINAMPEPAPGPSAVPPPEPAVDLAPGTAPEPVAVAVPEPVPEPEPEPVPAPEPVPEPLPIVMDPAPEAVPESEPEPVAELPDAANAAPVSEPEVETVAQAIAAEADPAPPLPPVSEPVPEPQAAPEPETVPVANLPVPVKRDRSAEAGEAALRILDLTTSGQGLLPQERALAVDSLLLLLPRMSGPQLVKFAERVAAMDVPPPLVAAMLIRDPRPEVMAPVLERSVQLSDRDMIAAAPVDDIERLRIIARRRVHSPELSRHLVASRDPAVILSLLRNPGSQLGHHAFSAIAACAAEHPALLAPLVTRPELPVAIAFELYWKLPAELRRLMLSRFLTDSTILGRILKVLATQDGLAVDALREERAAAPEDIDAAIDAAAAGLMDDACRRLGSLSGLAEATVRRIFYDPQGEALVVLFKVMAVNRPRFLAAIQKLRAGGVLPDQPGDTHLQTVFESMSFTKARILVTYWDWSARKIGPYATSQSQY